MEDGEGEGGPAVRLTEEPRSRLTAFTFPVPDGADVISIRRCGPGGRTLETTVLGSDGRRQGGSDVPVQALLEAPFQWQAAVCFPRLSGSGWSGRFFLFDPNRAGRRQLRFLQVVVRHTGPALFNVYLQRRLQSRSSVVDRARISRELHDGVIQTLVGLKMEIEVLGRELQARLTEHGRSRFEQVERTLDDQILDVRDLMQTLKPSAVPPERFVEHLAEALERFRYRTGIDTRLSCEADDMDLPAAVCGELSAIVQEALANVRKHSGASKLLVSLVRVPAGWQLAIDDNGEGFDFAGRFTGDELERSRLGPLMIREPAKAVGGRLVVTSNPGRGARLEITIPGQERDDGTATDQNRYRRRSSDFPGGAEAPVGSGA